MRPTDGRSTAVLVGLASVGSAAVSYVVTLLGTRSLGSVSETTQFLTFTSIVFTAYGVLGGLSSELTRAHATAEQLDRRRGPRTSVAALCVALLGGTAMAVAWPVWSHLLVHPEGRLVALLPLAVVLYVGHAALVGATAGDRLWRLCSTTIALEAALRLLATALVCVVGATIFGLGAATALGALAWLVLICLSPTARRAMSQRLDHAAARMTARIVASMTAQGASAVLVVGFPVLLSATTPAHDYLSSAPLILAVTLTRAPLLIPLNAYQGVVVSTFIHRGGKLAVSRRVAVLIFLAVLAIVLAAGLVGPFVLELLFGSAYRSTGSLLALLTIGAVLLALLTFSGSLCQALDRHRWFLSGWVVAVVVAVAVLNIPGAMDSRAVAALLLGPAAGLAVHAIFLSRSAAVQRGSKPIDEESRDRL